MKRRKVLIVTGARAEFGLFLPIVQAVRRHPRLELDVVATGMHLSRRHGHSIEEVLRHVPSAATIPMPVAEDTGPGMGRALARGLTGLLGYMETTRPHTVLVLGDRAEALAGALAGMYAGYRVAHLHGGELTGGGFDEPVRHAITQLADLHLPATKAAERRIRRLRPDARARIVRVGAPGLDAARAAPRTSAAAIRGQWGLPAGRPYLLVVQHPMTWAIDHAAAEMEAVLQGVVACEVPALVVYPNNDAGSRKQIAVLRRFVGRHAQLRSVPNVEHTLFLATMRHAAALVGNSSAGMIEAPFFGTPVVNVGTRQKGREHGENTFHVAADATRIARAVRRALGVRRSRAGSPYGDGKTGPRVARVLAEG